MWGRWFIILAVGFTKIELDVHLTHKVKGKRERERERKRLGPPQRAPKGEGDIKMRVSVGKRENERDR